MDGLRAKLGQCLGLPDTLPKVQDCVLHCPDHPGPFPAILYCHAHGGEYALGRRELIDGASWLSAPYLNDLVARGFAVLCIDMPGFGDRRDEGSESALSKAGLWQGRPLFGQMVAQQLAAVEWLAAQSQVDPKRIATLGMSMGGALAMWTAALASRVSAAVQLCMFADMRPLIETGVHDRHGPYLTVPGLLQHCDIGDVAALIAPRPQFIGLGADDPFTPPRARDTAFERVRAGYSAHGGTLETFVSPGTGHKETPEMRKAVLSFLVRTLVQQKLETRIPC